jgi:hypothetical protein
MPELPPLNLEEASFHEGSGYFAADMLARLGKQTVSELAEVRNVARADVLALIQSIQGTWRLAIELTAVEAELKRASNNELARYLSEIQYWYAESSQLYFSSYTPRYRDRNIQRWQSFERSQEEITKWIDEHVGGPLRSDFLELVERRAELRAAVVQASLTFEETRKEITEAVRKSRIVVASEQVNADAGDAARPELELENAVTARGLVNAVSAGLDKAYFAALDEQPELSKLDAAAHAKLPKIERASTARHDPASL